MPSLPLIGEQLGNRQRPRHRAVDLSVEDEPDVAAGHFDAVGVRDHLTLPVHDAVAL